VKPAAFTAAGFTLYAPPAASTTPVTVCEAHKNPLMGSAAMDLLVHRGIKIVIQGKSYRLESFMKRVKNRAAAGMSPQEAHESQKRPRGGGNVSKGQEGRTRVS